jgi:hypothetical protein
VVTFYDPNVDPRHAALFVHDSTGSIFIGLPSRPILGLKPGTRVEVTGVSGTGDYAPLIRNGHVRAIGNSHVPESAPRPTMAELFGGRMDGQWVEIEGIVHSVRLLPTNANLEVVTVGGPITATAPREAGTNYDSLVDARVQIRGNAVPVFNGVSCFRPCMKSRLYSLPRLIPTARRPFRSPNCCGSPRGSSCGTARISEVG